jgi:hypothetical protein
MAAIRFDPRPILGRKIVSARLFLHTTQPDNQLRYIRISTVNQDWVEGNSRRSYGHRDRFGVPVVGDMRLMPFAKGSSLWSTSSCSAPSTI